MIDSKHIPTLSRTYSEGKYFDLWSVVHFLTGTVIGLSAHLVGIPELIAYVGTFVGLVLYEFIEEYFNIEETLENRLSDIVLGYIGFALFYIILSPQLSFALNQLLLVVAGSLMMIGAVTGWRAYEKRSGRSE